MVLVDFSVKYWSIDKSYCWLKYNIVLWLIHCTTVDCITEFNEVVDKVKELYSAEEQGTGAGISLLELKNHGRKQFERQTSKT